MDIQNLSDTWVLDSRCNGTIVLCFLDEIGSGCDDCRQSVIMSMYDDLIKTFLGPATISFFS